MNIDGLPQELRQYPHWCLWKLEQRKGKPSKVPYNPRNGNMARSNDPGTFAPLDIAERACSGYGGIGIGLFDGMAGIDIDHCIENGKISDLATDIISTVESYAEVSPSGTGVHIYFKLPGFTFDKAKYYTKNPRNGVEVYIAGCTNRYLTVTGGALQGSPAFNEVAPEVIAAVLDKHMLRNTQEQQTITAPAPAAEGTADQMTARLLADEVIAKAAKSKQGAEFSALLSGDISSYPSKSEADLAFCNMLAFWCNKDTAAMDALFRQSGLMCEKWDEQRGQQTYGEITLAKAVRDLQGEGYNPDSPAYQAKRLRQAQEEFAAVSEQSAREVINPLSNPKRYTPDDKGNGYLFADSFKDELRYCPEAKHWYRYDGTRWKSDGDQVARERAKALADYVWGIVPSVPPTEQEWFIKNAKALCNQPKRETMLKDAQSVYPLYQSQLDSDIALLNCRNCTLNLSTEEYAPHAAAHMISKIAGADFVLGAKCSRWEQFIDEIMMGDKAAAWFLQKLFGYCLTGEPVEEKLFILYGATTRNGKSTLLDTVAAVMGDYARSMQPETLAEPRYQDGGKPSPDWAEMAGVRLCAVSEPSNSLHLNAAKVKSVTGRSPIKARFLYAGFFQYNPQFSIVIDTNHQPIISDNTLFASGRVVIIPFNRHFEDWERDTSLKAQLRTPAAMSGILMWMLEGLKAYRAEGLVPPESIRGEIARYQHDSDKITQFIEECIEVVPNLGLSAQISTVYNEYRAWCRSNGVFAESMKKFSPAFTGKGMRVERRNTGKFVLDIRLNSYSFNSYSE